MAQGGSGGRANDDGGEKNIFNRAIGVVPKPIRRVVAGGLDALDTPRAAVVSLGKEVQDAADGRGFSFGDLVSQTRRNISMGEVLEGRIGGPDWLTPALGLGFDIALGGATMPGIGTVKAGTTGLARGAKLGTGTIARNAVEAQRARVFAEMADPTTLAANRLRVAEAAAASGGATPGQAYQAGTRFAMIGDKDVKDTVKIAAEMLVKGQKKLSGKEMATMDRARRLMIGRTAIPGTEKIADAISTNLGRLIPKETIVRHATRRGGEAATFAQKFDAFGMTGSRLRDAALDALEPGGSHVRLLGEMEAAAARSKGLGAASVRAREALEGRDPGANAAANVVSASHNVATRGLHRHIKDTFGTDSINEALKDLRSAPDRGAFEMKAAFDRVVKGRRAGSQGGKLDVLLAKELDDLYNLDQGFWNANPDLWARAKGALGERIEMFTKQVAQDSTFGVLKQPKRMLSGQRDVVSTVLAPWAQDVAKGLGAAKIADPEALVRMAVATDPWAIANGAKTIKLGAWGEISEDVFRRVTGTYGMGGSGKDKVADFTRHVQGVTNMFRSFALMSPAFSNRNFVGGLLNNYANGVTLGDARWAAKQYKHFSMATDPKVAPALQAAARRKIDPHFAAMMERQGDTLHTLTRGAETDPFAGRVRTGAQYAQQSFDKTGFSARGILTGTVDTKAPVEVVLRGAAFKRGLSMGLTEEGAWAFAQKIHIDYQDLSSFDVSLRRVMPFAMWATRNPGLQMEYLARGMGAGGPLEVAMLNAQQREEGSAFPPFLAGSNFALGGGDVLNLSAAPSTDLFSTLEGKKNIRDVALHYLAQTTPPVQQGLELVAGHELDTGRPLNWQRQLTGFAPIANTVTQLTGFPKGLRSRSQLPGWQGRLPGAGFPLSVRRYTG